MQTRRLQKGSALLAATVMLLACIGIVFAMELTAPASAAQRERASDRALAQAREALIAYASDRPVNFVVGPGYLPCPDLDDDGWAEATCGSQSGDSGQAARLGRLPWKTLGLPDLRDGHGERLWYAVSSKYKGLLNCGVSPACLDMAPGSALGTITVRDSAGTLMHDATIGEAYRADAGGAVAVVIAPGPPLRRAAREGDGIEQSRVCAPGDCSASGRCVADPPQRAAHCDPLNFLDKAPGDRFGDEDNADFIDRNDSAGRPRNANGFIQGPVTLSGGRIAVNDRLIAISYRDVMPRIMGRVALEVAHCLRYYASRPENFGRYPWPTPVCLQADNLWGGQRDVFFGRIPDTPFDATLSGPMLERWWRAEARSPEDLRELPTASHACRIAIAPLDEAPQRSLQPALPPDEGHTAGRDANSWWTAWKPYVFYALARGFSPGAGTPSCDGAGCLDVVEASGRTLGGPRHFAVIVAGAPVVRDGFVQSRSGAGISNPGQWLEETNAQLEGSGGCPRAPSFPCEGRGSCSRVTAGTRTPGFNDVVVAIP